MALGKENARTSSLRATISKAVTNGISLVSPMLHVATRGINKSAKSQPVDYSKSWRNVKWGAAGGPQASGYGWRITKTRSTADVTTGQLRTLDFDEPDLLANPVISYYMVDKTWAIGEGDLALSKKSETRITSIRKDRMVDAQNAIYAELSDIPWNINETAQNGGLSMFSPTNVSGSTTYAGIAMDAGAYWQCTGYDYGNTLTLAANLFAIVSTLKRQLTFSEDAGGGGRRLEPDFGVMDPDAWVHLITYLASKTTWNINDGTHPANANMLEAGFENIVINGVTLFWDDNFGGSTGYVDGAAAEEILMGHSSKIFLATTNSKSEGFVTANGLSNQPWITGELGRFKTGMFCMGYESPKFFQVAYT